MWTNIEGAGVETANVIGAIVEIFDNNSGLGTVALNTALETYVEENRAQVREVAISFREEEPIGIDVALANGTTIDFDAAIGADQRDTVRLYETDGLKSLHATLNSDGLLRYTIFNEGERVQTTVLDIESTTSWTKTINNYENNARINKVVISDDGTQRTDTFESGIRTLTTFAKSGDAGNYTKHITYESNGQVSSQTIKIDGQTKSITTYENGVRKTFAEFGDDSAEPVRHITYDNNGSPVEDHRFREDDLLQVTSYYDHRSPIVNYIDQSPSGAGSTYEWSSKQRYVTDEGSLVVATLMDNTDYRITETSIDDVRTTLRVDNSNSETWQTLVTMDAGQGNLLTYSYLDNLDETITFVSAEKRIARLDFDGDSSESWVYQFVEYHDNVAILGATFDTAEEVGLHISSEKLLEFVQNSSNFKVQTIDLPSASIFSYRPDQDYGAASISSVDSSVTLVENAWKSVANSQEIDSNTVLRFEFKSDSEGEIHAIGVANNDIDDPNLLFQIDGTQRFGNQSVAGQYETGSGWQTYEIEIGQHLTGNFDRLTLIMDNDSSLVGDSSFRNIEFVDEIIYV